MHRTLFCRATKWASRCVLSPHCFAKAACSHSELHPVLLCTRMARANGRAGGCVISPARSVKAACSRSVLCPIPSCTRVARAGKVGWCMRAIAALPRQMTLHGLLGRNPGDMARLPRHSPPSRAALALWRPQSSTVLLRAMASRDMACLVSSWWSGGAPRRAFNCGGSSPQKRCSLCPPTVRTVQAAGVAVVRPGFVPMGLAG